MKNFLDLWKKTPTNIIHNNSYVENLDPNNATVVGGICGTKITSLDAMGRISSVSDFEIWHKSWYPRFDQIHDAFGIPPKACKKIQYVFEDSTHATRIKRIKPDWNFFEIQHILKDAHSQFGHTALQNWLSWNNWTGTIECVYLSDLEKEIDLALRIAKNLGLKADFKEQAIRKLMYTALWPSILGIESSAVIFEPIHYLHRHRKKDYGNWLDDVGIMCYEQYMMPEFEADKIPHDVAIHRGNYESKGEKKFNFIYG